MGLAWIAAVAVACGRRSPDPVAKTPENAAVETDSARLIARAIAAMDSVAGESDTIKLRVVMFTRAADETVIQLAPVAVMPGGGGTVTFARDGSVRRVMLEQ